MAFATVDALVAGSGVALLLFWDQFTPVARMLVIAVSACCRSVRGPRVPRGGDAQGSRAGNGVSVLFTGTAHQAEPGFIAGHYFAALPRAPASTPVEQSAADNRQRRLMKAQIFDSETHVRFIERGL